MILKPESVFGYPANSMVQLGLIGCGGRGTTVATSMMKETQTCVVAIADIFQDKLDAGREKFNQLCREKNRPVMRMQTKSFHRKY